MTWRETRAASLDADAGMITDTLELLAEVEAILEAHRSDGLLVELRAFTGGLRAEASGYAGEARDLRTDDSPPAMPMQLTAAATTRHPRGDR